MWSFSFISPANNDWSLLRKHAWYGLKEPVDAWKRRVKAPGQSWHFSPTVMQAAFWGDRNSKSDKTWKKEETAEKARRMKSRIPLCQERSITTLNHRGRALPRKCLSDPSPGRVTNLPLPWKRGICHHSNEARIWLKKPLSRLTK